MLRVASAPHEVVFALRLTASLVKTTEIASHQIPAAGIQRVTLFGCSSLKKYPPRGSGRHEWRHLSLKAPKECSKKFAATFKGKFLTRGNVLRIFLLFFLEDLGVPL